MRQIISAIFTLMFMTVMTLHAKTLHWLTFIDTTDSNVGEIDKNTRKLLYSRWINIVNAVLKENGYSVNVVDVYGSELSPEKCKSVVNNLRCSDEDIVIFYYVGHGTENTGASKYPLMLMGQSNVNKFIPLTWVHNKLKDKGARMTLTIGMCCNARQGAPGRLSPSFGTNYGNTYVDQDMSVCIKKLFLNYRGDMLLTSASPTESSWACGSSVGDTDYFTLELLIQFNDVLPNKSNPDWSEMLQTLKYEVYNNVRNNTSIQRSHPGATQTPLWENNLTTASAPQPTNQEQPSQVVSSGSKTEVKTQLDKLLCYISSYQVDEMDRITLSKKMERLFAKNTVVRIMSQDGNVVVDKETPEKFLSRIATTPRIMNVSIVDLNLNPSGYVSSLRVREIYKK